MTTVESYLDWFHQIHISEKLARPLYYWTAHFEGTANTLSTQSSIPLFGGISNHMTLNLSPAQLKTKKPIFSSPPTFNIVQAADKKIG